MREFKFRFWNSKDGILWKHDELAMIIMEGTKLTPLYDCGSEYREIEDAENITTMQYTGLKDIDGIEVYEGDILSHTKSGKEYLCKVVYSNSGFYTHGINFRTINPLATSNKRVVGNIYENPELLGD